MKTLLKLTGQFATQWTAADPDGRIIERNPADGSIPYISGLWIEAAYTPESARTDTRRNRLALSDSLIDEVLAASSTPAAREWVVRLLSSRPGSAPAFGISLPRR